MYQIIEQWRQHMALAKGSKRNQHYINMDGFKCYYEQIGSRGHK